MSTLSAQGGPATALEGNWEGQIGAIRIVFHFTRGADGAFAGTLDSPDQGALGLPMSAVSFKSGVVELALDAPPATYSGHVNGDQLTGEWRQGGGSVPLNLKRVSATSPASTPKLDRPQEPKPPFPYRSEDMTYPSKSSGVTLAATLTLPPGDGPFPAVLLITGSGPQNRDEELMGHKPFLVIADYLTRAGIAVLRVDDRGTAKSTGDFAAATTADFVDDAAGSVAYLVSRKEIDHKRIGLIGHSEGAIIAPLLATKSSDVAFVIMMAGTAVTGREVMVAQAAAIMRAGGAPQAAIDENAAMQNRLFALSAEPDAAKREAMLQAILAEIPEAQRKSIEAQAKGVGTPWFRYFATFDPAPVLRRLKTPVLVLNGSLDLQVLPSQNLPMIAKCLEEAGNADYEIVKFPGLNHLFQNANTGTPMEYAQIPETIAPVALETMAAWIKRHR